MSAEDHRLEISAFRNKYGKREVVRGVDMNASGGEVGGLLGPNGAGKTTTFSMIAGFVTPSAGRLLLNGVDLTSFPAYKRARRGLVYLPQEPSVFRKLTVEENIRAIAETLPISTQELDELVQTRLEELTLSALAGQKASTLSGGERRRLEITRALVLSQRSRSDQCERSDEDYFVSQIQRDRDISNRPQRARDPESRGPCLLAA